MTKGEFLERLNAENARLGRSKVTPRMLRDWVDEGNIDGPAHHGRRRVWSEQHFLRGLDICRLKSDGSVRAAEIRVRLWLEGNDFPHDEVKEAVSDEFERLRKRALRRATTTAEREPTDRLTQRRLGKIAGQLGAKSKETSILKIRYPERELFDACKLMRFGEETVEITKLATHLLGEIGLGQYTFLAESIDRKYRIALSGLLGEQDEIDGSLQETIEKVSEADLLTAKRIIDGLLKVIEAAVSILSTIEDKEIGKAVKAFDERVFNVKGFWRLPVFLFILHWLHHVGDNGNSS